MGKAFLVILLIGAAAFFIYREVHHPASAEELKVKAIEEQFLTASSKLIGAGGGPTVVGLDVVESAAAQVRRLRGDLAFLSRTLSEEKAIARAESLRLKIDEFCRKNDID